jgi:predicted RNase H-like nuclease
MIRGVDGCSGGWLVIWSNDAGDGLESRVFADASTLFQQTAQITAIDIPVGLPSTGARKCDVAARRILGRRRSSVFPAPVRGVLSASSFEIACNISLQLSGKKLSKQTYAILPRIADVDRCLREDVRLIETVREVHPEVCFTVWNENRPMKYPKLSGFGFVERLRLVDKRWPGSAERIREAHPNSVVSDDDILDAFAALWTALRIRVDGAVRIGPAEGQDEAGLLSCIWA